jgi:DNA-directed RNA polymerase specialized sigma subunit
MWKTYQHLASQYPKISLDEERQLISKAKKCSKEKAEELVLRHVTFVISRIHKKSFPSYVNRFGEDILSEAMFILYEKIKSYDLEYKDKQGNLKPVRFSSYIWKRIDGFIIDSVKKEIRREKSQGCPNWERFESELSGSRADNESAELLFH